MASRPSGFRGTGTSPAKGGLGMTHDCSIGQLHDAYITLCRKVNTPIRWLHKHNRSIGQSCDAYMTLYKKVSMLVVLA